MERSSGRGTGGRRRPPPVEIKGKTKGKTGSKEAPSREGDCRRYPVVNVGRKEKEGEDGKEGHVSQQKGNQTGKKWIPTTGA